MALRNRKIGKFLRMGTSLALLLWSTPLIAGSADPLFDYLARLFGSENVQYQAALSDQKGQQSRLLTGEAVDFFSIPPPPLVGVYTISKDYGIVLETLGINFVKYDKEKAVLVRETLWNEWLTFGIETPLVGPSMDPLTDPNYQRADWKKGKDGWRVTLESQVLDAVNQAWIEKTAVTFFNDNPYLNTPDYNSGHYCGNQACEVGDELECPWDCLSTMP